MGLEHRMTLLGFRRDITRLLSISDFLVHTAVSEAFGRVVIEAMAAGLPVAAFDTDGVAEIVLCGQTGLLVPKGDTGALAASLAQLASDPALRGRLGQQAQRRAQDLFSAEGTARGVRDVIEQVVGER